MSNVTLRDRPWLRRATPAAATPGSWDRVSAGEAGRGRTPERLGRPGGGGGASRMPSGSPADHRAGQRRRVGGAGAGAPASVSVPKLDPGRGEQCRRRRSSRCRRRAARPARRRSTRPRSRCRCAPGSGWAGDDRQRRRARSVSTSSQSVNRCCTCGSYRRGHALVRVGDPDAGRLIGRVGRRQRALEDARRRSARSRRPPCRRARRPGCPPASCRRWRRSATTVRSAPVRRRRGVERGELAVLRRAPRARPARPRGVRPAVPAADAAVGGGAGSAGAAGVSAPAAAGDDAATGDVAADGHAPDILAVLRARIAP